MPLARKIAELTLLGKPIGRFHVVAYDSDDTLPIYQPQCDCATGHASTTEALICPKLRKLRKLRKLKKLRKMVHVTRR